jgi:hypothetical protein
VLSAFTGWVSNRANIDMSIQEMTQPRNEEHPVDLILLEAEPERQP